MRVFLYDGYRNLCEKTTKATFNNIKDLTTYWLDRNEQLIKEYPGMGTHEEAIKVTNQTVEKISSVFKDGDEIIHFNDYGIAMKKCEREFLLLKRGEQIIKSVITRMS